jgi:DNA-binding NtrC family response regulator
VDVRIVAATNANLDRLVADGGFREDLFYRLNVIRFPLPPLRERREEIPPLAHHFLRHHAEDQGQAVPRLSDETLEYLLLYRWPGNVRELGNEMRRLVAFADPGAVIEPDALSPHILASRRTVPAAPRPSDRTVQVTLGQPLQRATDQLERAMIVDALAKTGGRVEAAARLLGLSRKGLYLKRQRLSVAS